MFKRVLVGLLLAIVCTPVFAMKVERQDITNGRIYRIAGQVRINTQDEFKNLFRTIRDETGTNRTAIVNLDGVVSMNSAGLDIIMNTYKEMKNNKSRMILCCLQSDIRSLFEVTKQDRFIEIYRTEAEAVKAAGKK